jgi:NADH-quinone oxidoreductase subunit E
VIADAEAKKPGEAANVQERPDPKPPADDATSKTDKTS